jgi:hypothetical protein
MAYTFGGFKAKTSPDNFGGLRVDANRIGMTGALGNYMQSKDGTATPVYSPITNGSASGLILTVPQGAVQFYIYIASAVTALMGEDSTYTYGLFIPTATLCGPFDVGNQQYIYLLPSSATNSIYFQFKMV